MPFATKTNRRKYERRRVCYAADIVIDGGMDPFNVSIRNLSPDGAAIASPPGRLLPSRFLLQLPRVGAQVFARLIWKNGETIGLAFDAPITLAAA